ncbi:hypothetical protein Ciccas_004471, partial [Cichlidogyrus casuarinus]
MANSSGHLISELFELYLKHLISLATGVFEGPSFSYGYGESSKFLLHANRGKPICLEDFLEKMLSEPGSPSLVWLTIFHRLALVENVTHNIKCQACQREPLIGLRYKCTKCVRYNLCQDCFWMGAITDFHTNAHDVKEYTAPTKSHTRQFGHTLRKLVRHSSSTVSSQFTDSSSSHYSSSPAVSSFEFAGPKAPATRFRPPAATMNAALMGQRNVMSPQLFYSPGGQLFSPQAMPMQRLFVNTNLPAMRMGQQMGAGFQPQPMHMPAQNPVFFSPQMALSSAHHSGAFLGNSAMSYMSGVPFSHGPMSPLLRYPVNSLPATAPTTSGPGPVSPDGSQLTGNTEPELHCGKISPHAVVKLPQSVVHRNDTDYLIINRPCLGRLYCDANLYENDICRPVRRRIQRPYSSYDRSCHRRSFLSDQLLTQPRGFFSFSKSINQFPQFPPIQQPQELTTDLADASEHHLISSYASKLFNYQNSDTTQSQPAGFPEQKS